MALEPLAIGVMLGVGESPEESIQKVLDVGVTNAQMGRPGDAWLRPDKDKELKKLIKAKGAAARYVRLYSKGNTASDLTHYTEVEVYALPAK